jgi:hypothetical protein
MDGTAEAPSAVVRATTVIDPNGTLPVRHVIRRLRAIVKSTLPDVADDADDFTRRRCRETQTRRNPLADRALSRPDSPRHRFVDDDHWRRRRRILIGEQTARDQPHADRLKIAWRDERHERRRFVAGRRRRATADSERWIHLGSFVRERERRRRTDRHDARLARDALFHLGEELRAPLRLRIVAPDVRGERDATIHAVAEVHAQQRGETSDEQAVSHEQDDGKRRLTNHQRRS